MSIKQNRVNVFRDLLSTKVLKSSDALYSIFTSDVLELTKTVDRPDDYYMEGDDITFNISIKNNGDKIVRNFVIKDEMEKTLLTVENNEYMVTATHGVIAQEDNIVIISELTLLPGEEALISISGLISTEEEDSEQEEIEESNEDNQEVEYFSFNEKTY